MKHPLAPLIEQLKQLPSIGQKSAERLAFYILSQPTQKIHALSSAIQESKETIKYCETCYNLTLERYCQICTNPARSHQQLCVVSDARAIYAIERMQRFQGKYHVLGGLLSPLDGMHPDTLRIKELVQRTQHTHFEEIILAINPSIEGEATILYLKSVLSKVPSKISTLAHGLPVGADLDYIDELTLEKAYIGRESTKRTAQ